MGTSQQEGTQEPSKREPSWMQLPIEDQAYFWHLRGLSLRAIGQKLHIDKDTANRYVRAVEKEREPRRKETRRKLLDAAIARLRAIATDAAERFDETGEAALLNTRATCEREIARLHGLYATVGDDEGLSGITITISRRREPDGGAAD